MNTTIQCCPVCGKLLSYRNIKCFYCGYSKHINKEKRKELQNLIDKREIAYMPIDTYNSTKPLEYYEDQSFKKYGNKKHWKEIFVQQELSNNPLFDLNKYKNTLNKEKQIIEKDHFERTHHREQDNLFTPNLPKCPTCGSTNIKKISDLRKGIHGLAWGILSKTARSQFECRNCGYKW